MTIAVISDVHGNLSALTAVLSDIESRGISRIWCLGDTLGYGPQPNECLARVLHRCEVVLAGNHDLAVRGDIDPSVFRGTAGAGIEWARRTLTPAHRAALDRLRAWAFTDDAELYHASANDNVWEYVRDVRVAERHLQTQRMAVSFVGHSHEQRYFARRDATGQVTGDLLHEAAQIDITSGKYVCNPGSVGQPRDRDPRAAWALFTPGSSVVMHRTSYDIAATRAAIAAAGLPSEVGERLELGW